MWALYELNYLPSLKRGWIEASGEADLGGAGCSTTRDHFRGRWWRDLNSEQWEDSALIILSAERRGKVIWNIKWLSPAKVSWIWVIRPAMTFRDVTVNGLNALDWKGQRNCSVIVLILPSFYLDVISWSLSRRHNLFLWSSLFKPKTREGICLWASPLCAQPLSYLLLSLLLRTLAVQLDEYLPGLNSKDHWQSGKRKISVGWRQQESPQG